MTSSSSQFADQYPLLSFDHEGLPQFAVMYYPNGPFEEDVVASPHPRLVGWTDQAMRIAAKRLRATGIDMVLIHADIDGLGTDEMTSGYRRFAGYLDSAGQPYALYVDGSDVTGTQLAGFLDWMMTLGLHDSAMCLKDGGKPVLFVADGAGVWGIRHLGIAPRGIAWESVPGDLLPPSVRAISPTSQAVRVVAGVGTLNSDGSVEWALKRKAGGALRAGLTAAIELKPELVVIDSWNNYADGSFIEPNSLDRAKVAEALGKFITGLKSEGELR